MLKSKQPRESMLKIHGCDCGEREDAETARQPASTAALQQAFASIGAASVVEKLEIG
jgi:hypothetical protein